MKITRRKRLQRYLGFYKNNFHFRSPFQILVDGTFCQAALKFKINIKEQMPKYLDNEVKLLTTPCVVTEIEKLGSTVYGAMLILKQYSAHRCGHEKQPISGDKCLMEMVQKGNNENHYMIATQDQGLADKVRSTAGVPLLFIHFNAIIMEKPSDTNEEAVKGICSKKMQLTSYQKDVLQQLAGTSTEQQVSKPKKRRIRGPNPLSCKKKKLKQMATNIPSGGVEKSKRKRKRTKLAKHVKEVLLSKNIKTDILKKYLRKH